MTDDIEVFGWVIFITLILVNAVIMLWPKRRNRRVGLPPPSDACKRNGTQAVP